MSHLEEDPNRHDLHLSVAIRILQTNSRARLIHADGGLPFKDQVVKSPASLLSYRPDAILQDSECFWITEVKSYGDCFSARTLKQLTSVLRLLNNTKDWKLFLFIFDVPSAGANLPKIINKISEREDAEIFYVYER